jgi:hypothetical protein
MAQTGFTPIQLYSSSTATNVPLATNLATGELAINITDGKLFYKDNANAVQVIGWKVVPATAGGTGQTSYAIGDLLYADTTTTLAKLPDVATGNALISGGVSTAPSWGKIGLTTHVSGVLPVANGGTNASTASITSFNNITGYSASGATGTTTTNLVFSTSPTLTTPIATTTIGVGNTTPAASGAGITFPATQSASSNANTLDDYERGAWSPSIGGSATYTSQIGQYVKIGNVVTCTFLITINVIGTGSVTTLSGFPFAGVNAGLVQSGNVSYYGSIATSVTSLHFYLQNNGTTALFTGNAAAATTIGNVINVFQNSATVYGSITYVTN